MRILDFPQQSEEWENARRIRPTASRFSEIFTAKKADLSASSEKLALEIITQQRFRANPDPVKWTGNANTDNGNEREAEAREAFAKATYPLAFERDDETKQTIIHQVGLCVEDHGFYACSPDGLIKDAAGNWIAGVEIKCPLSHTHMGYLLEKKLPDAYIQQVHGSMYVTGLRKWWFVSYFPSLPMLIIPIEWDDAYGAKMIAAFDEFRILYAKKRQEVDAILKAGKAA